jgi:hypothetical protein
MALCSASRRALLTERERPASVAFSRYLEYTNTESEHGVYIEVVR